MPAFLLSFSSCIPGRATNKTTKLMNSCIASCFMFFAFVDTWTPLHKCLRYVVSAQFCYFAKMSHLTKKKSRSSARQSCGHLYRYKNVHNLLHCPLESVSYFATFSNRQTTTMCMNFVHILPRSAIIPDPNCTKGIMCVKSCNWRILLFCMVFALCYLQLVQLM